MHSKSVDYILICFLHVHDSRWSSLGSCFTNAFKVWGLYSNMFTCAWFKVIEFRIMFYKCIHRLRIRFYYVLHMHDSGYEFRIMFYKCIHSLRVRVYLYLLFAFITYWPSDYFWILSDVLDDALEQHRNTTGNMRGGWSNAGNKHLIQTYMYIHTCWENVNSNNDDSFMKWHYFVIVTFNQQIPSIRMIILHIYVAHHDKTCINDIQ